MSRSRNPFTASVTAGLALVALTGGVLLWRQQQLADVPGKAAAQGEGTASSLSSRSASRATERPVDRLSLVQATVAAEAFLKQPEARSTSRTIDFLEDELGRISSPGDRLQLLDRLAGRVDGAALEIVFLGAPSRLLDEIFDAQREHLPKEQRTTQGCLEATTDLVLALENPIFRSRMLHMLGALAERQTGVDIHAELKRIYRSSLSDAEPVVAGYFHASLYSNGLEESVKSLFTLANPDTPNPCDNAGLAADVRNTPTDLCDLPQMAAVLKSITADGKIKPSGRVLDALLLRATAEDPDAAAEWLAGGNEPESDRWRQDAMAAVVADANRGEAGSQKIIDRLAELTAAGEDRSGH